MIRLLLLAGLFLLMALPAAAEWSLTPRTMVNGGVAILRWQGETAMDVALATFDEETFFLDRDDKGLFALIGVDVKTEPGEYPVRIAGIDVAGKKHIETFTITVADAQRPVDELTLPKEMVSPQKKEILDRISRENRLLRIIFSENSGPFIGGPLRRPVPDRVSSVFGTRRILNGEPKAPHSGTDFRSPMGRVIRAPAAGRVVFADDLYYTGRTVILDHGSGIFSLYAHLQSYSCKVGAALKPGEALGKVGSSGRSTGAHLHWTVKIRGAKVDPMELLARYRAQKPLTR